MSSLLIRVVAVLLIALTPLFAIASPAAACSCRYSTVEETVEDWDNLFVGRLISTRESTPEIKASGPFRTMTHVFEVESVIKGEFERLTIVYSPWGGAACGLEGRAAAGELVGLRTLPVGDGTHDSNLCLVGNANEILAYAGDNIHAPLPISPERERQIRDDIDTALRAEIDLAAEARAADDLERSNRGVDWEILVAGSLVAVAVGYALWRFVLRNRQA